MFEKSLTALIKGLRSHRGRDEAQYVALMLDDIRTEVKSGDMDIKSQAVLKLAYLQMLGYQASSVSFHIVETMASTKFDAKFIGYLAAALCFSQDTEVLILATNMIKKDLYSAVPQDVAAALNGLSHIITQELAQHLAGDIIAMLSHTRPAIRKRALLVLYSAIVKYPEILDSSMERLRDRLDDPEPSVVTAAVNVVCELARRKPEPFVLLSPQLFHILTTATNNWVLIKVIKLFGSLAQVEPRLVRRLAPRISDIISTTPAMSLLYECIHTLIVGGMFGGTSGEELAHRCVDNLSRFLTDDDQNLKYIALLALVKMLPTHAHLVALHQETILHSLRHPDLTIRLRSLDLACGLASRTNLYRIVTALVTYLADERSEDASSALLATINGSTSSSESSNFRMQVAESILDLGCANDYGDIPDYVWYFDLLLRLTEQYAHISARAADQIIVIASRDENARTEVISRLRSVVDDLFDKPELLRAGAWIWGEFPGEVEDVPELIRALLRDEVRSLSPSVIATVMEAAVKMYARWTARLSEVWGDDARAALDTLSEHIISSYDMLSKCEHPEVHQRATEGLHLFEFMRAELESGKDTGAPRSLHLLEPLFFTQPVDVDAETHPLPMSVDLREWIVPQITWAQVQDLVEPKERKSKNHDSKKMHNENTVQPRVTYENDPFYLGKSRKPRHKSHQASTAFSDTADDLDDVPVVQLSISELDAQPEVSIPADLEPKKVARKKKRSKAVGIV